MEAGVGQGGLETPAEAS